LYKILLLSAPIPYGYVLGWMLLIIIFI